MGIKFPNFIGNFWKNVKLDKWVLISLLVVLTIGLIAQSSVSQGKFFPKQLLFAFLGFPIFYLGYSLPTDALKRFCWFAYGFSIILLIWVLIKGTTALGAQRWISIGGFSLQPSEPAKIASIIALAYWFQSHKPKSILELIGSGFVILFLPFALIFIQPDLGTSMVLVAIFFAMAYWAGAQLAQVLALISPLIIAIASALGDKAFSLSSFHIGRHEIALDCTFLGLISICVLSAFFANHYQVWKSKLRSLALVGYTFFGLFVALIGRPIAWGMLEPYQQKRLTIFMDPYVDQLGAGYNIIQSLLAVGSGGLWGQGYKQGRLTQGLFVPEQHTDFIFSSICEEWGLIGALVLISAFAIICFRLYNSLKDVDDHFSKLIVVGVLTFLCFHVCINMGMNIGLMPVTGVPLPLISYGGTSMWITLFAIGLTQRIYADSSAVSMFK